MFGFNFKADSTIDKFRRKKVRKVRSCARKKEKERERERQTDRRKVRDTEYESENREIEIEREREREREKIKKGISKWKKQYRKRKKMK